MISQQESQRLSTWLKIPTALIRFSKEEMQNLILALVLAEDSCNTLSDTEAATRFKNLREDIVKIKDDLVKKEEEYEEQKATK